MESLFLLCGEDILVDGKLADGRIADSATACKTACADEVRVRTVLALIAGQKP
jgi:hypothetical protein